MLPCGYIAWDVFQVILVTRILKFVLVPFSCFQFLLYYCPPYEIGKEGSMLLLLYPLFTLSHTPTTTATTICELNGLLHQLTARRRCCRSPLINDSEVYHTACNHSSVYMAEL